MKEMTRRDFFKLSAAAALLIGGGLTGCSDSSLPVMFGDRIDVGDAYITFAEASIYGEDIDDNYENGSKIMGEYIVWVFPKDGKEITVKPEDFAMRVENVEAKQCQLFYDGADSEEEIEEPDTISNQTTLICRGVLIENGSQIPEGTPEWKLAEKMMSLTKTVELEAKITHSGKKIKAVTHEIDMILGD